MRIVTALGGNALLRRGERMTVEAQRENVRRAASHLAPLALEHELVVTHGNGPQVGLLALQAAAFVRDQIESGSEMTTTIPLDVLGAQSEGMIGYVIEQELGNLLPVDMPLATILTMIEVDPNDPVFDAPTKFIGPVYEEEEARALSEERGWFIAKDGARWRRVVPSPLPRRIFQLRPIRWLLELGSVVICAGGGGIPTTYGEDGRLIGTEVVIDKDRTSSLLARELEADVLVLATDVDGVFAEWGTPGQRLLSDATVAELQEMELPPGSMGAKVEAACDFVRTTSMRAVIGCLDDLDKLVAGTAGTQVRA